MGGGAHRSVDRRSPFYFGPTSKTRFVLIALFALLGFAAIGFIDDYAKVSKQRNLGLTAKTQNSLCKSLSASSLGSVASRSGDVQRFTPRNSSLPFLKAHHPDLVIHSLINSKTIFWPVRTFLPFFWSLSRSFIRRLFQRCQPSRDGLDGLAIGCTVIRCRARSPWLTYVSSKLPLGANYLEIQYIPARR